LLESPAGDTGSKAPSMLSNVAECDFSTPAVARESLCLAAPGFITLSRTYSKFLDSLNYY